MSVCADVSWSRCCLSVFLDDLVHHCAFAVIGVRDSIHECSRRCIKFASQVCEPLQRTNGTELLFIVLPSIAVALLDRA